ncbi:uncharacterized protein LOC132304075 isoform X2 [Cornus florida]|uniref:uncharacterized protein LOC132304075 isoform X2 n=1 Tax=Cornus florida TaxID=4283 RepID=UPI002896F773|nr:uncharacterized protein LOC132304075 isoform X2 [Cornus florida]
MDYDDNDSQGHNLHLAGEGSSKFSPVLSPYALPKFDFDDSLQGQLRFDSLVENEVFLGIPSQEDNQWIEDFSRGSSGIEFSSSVPESCSISRHNNVWSEATSSESVEMLLKSVGQEEMVLGETVIKESDASDELGSLTKQMESNSKQDDRMKDVIDSHPALPPSQFLENSSRLDESTERTHPHVEGASQTQVVELSSYGSSSELEPSAVDEKCGLCVTEKNLATDRKCNNANEAEADTSVNESLDKKMEKEPSVSGMQICQSSSQDNVASVGELNNQEIQHQLSFENVNGLSNDISRRADEEHVVSKDANLDDLNFKGSAVETGTYNLLSPLSSAPKSDSLDGLAIESNTNNFEESFLPLERDGDMQIAEECSEGACSIDPALGSKRGAVVLSKSTEINQQCRGDMQGAPVVFQGDGNIEGHAVEMGSNMQITDGQSSSIEKKENLLESDHQLFCEASVNNSEASLLSGVHYECSNGQGDGSSNDHVGDPSNLMVVCSSNELLLEKNPIEDLEVVNDPSAIHKKDLNAEHNVSPPMLAGSVQICERDLITKQGGDVHHAEDVSLNEKGNEKLSIDARDLDCETVGSLRLDSLGEGIKENDMIVHKSEHDPTAMNELAMNVALENTNLASHTKLDNVSLPSVNGAAADGVTSHGDEQKLPSPVVGFMHLDGSEETKVQVSKEANLLTLKKCSNGANELGPVSGLETGSSDSANQLLQVTVDQSLSMVESHDTASRNEHAEAGNLIQEGSRKLKDNPVLCDSFVKEYGNEAVVPENHGKTTRGENHDAVTSGIAVDVSKDHQGLLSECDADCALEGGGSSADSDKPNPGSPIVISCTELSKSEKDLQEGVKGSLGSIVPPSEVTDEIANKVQSSSPNQRGSDATKDESSFSFEVGPLTGLSERETGKGLQSFSSAPPCKISTVVEGTSTSGVGQMDPVIVPEISHGSKAPNGENSRRRSKGTLERKTRRVSGKPTGKENTKKGNLVKESTLAKQPERGDKSYIVSLSPSGTGQLVQFEGLKPYGNVENSGTRQCGVISIPASNMLDLNSSTLSSALFQQPFTDLQQVQLRAQIFVYGSLIQGTVPDEACMVSAFGTSDGGRNVWEPAWRACMESIQGQKSHPSNSDTPNQSRSGAKASDQAIKKGASQNKVLSSPGGRACSKGAPSPVVNSMIPPSSPLWNTSNSLQSSGVAKGTLLDYQTLSPLHPYHTPPTHNFVGHNTSWLSQSPFPGSWVASPQTSAFDGSARFSLLPITEAVKLNPVKESSLSISSSTKHASSSPVVLSGGPSVFAGASSLLDPKKVMVSPGQHSADPKSRKRKKVPVSEDLGHASLLAQTQTESLSTPVVSSHLSTSVAVTTAFPVSKSNASKFVSNVKPTSSTDQLKLGDQNAEQKVTISEGTFKNVELAKLEAEEAATLAAAAVSHSQGVWNQLNMHKNSRMISDVEAKLTSAAVAVAAAAAVAKAAAAAAKVASNAALQAKLMAEGALASGTGNTVISRYNTINNFGKATPSSILKGEGGDGSDYSSSIIVAAREASRGKLEAASAASKHAENLDAIVKAAELAAEAVSQAGKIVSMGDPLPLRELVDAGPEGYWKVPLVPSEHGVKSNKVSKDRYNMDGIDSVEEGINVSAKQAKEGLLDESPTTDHGLPPLSREISRELVKDHTGEVDGISGSITNNEKNLRGRKGRRASDLAKTIGVVPESEIGSRSTSVIIQDENEKAPGNLAENGIKEGSLVEVFKDGDFKAAWFTANLLSLKDGKALVGYTELQSDGGSGHLQEWVAIEGEDNKAPRIRTAHPMTTMRFEGMRKRRRAAMGDYAWSVGDRADAWVQDCWREGVVTEKDINDETALSVRFPAEGETSVVRAWNLRPTLIWKDGKWIEWSTSREKDSSFQGDMPQQKRLKMGSPAIQGKDNDKMSKNIDLVDSRRAEQSHLLPLTENEKIFNFGNHSRDENKPDVLRTLRSGLQKEGSKVIFGVPKPGKKRKFMDVSKHYDTERSSNNDESNDSVKFGKCLMPQVSDSHGWKKDSKIDFKEKQEAESKPKVVKSRKPPSVPGRTSSQKDKFMTSARSDGTMTDHVMKDSNSNDEHESGQRNLRGFRSFSNSEEADAEEGQTLFSSLALPSDVSSKKLPASNAKSERLNKGKLAASGGKFGKSEVKDKVYNGNMGKTIPEVVEPRRTTRRIQPTSRLLEGLQSSLIISKIPTTSHDKNHKSTKKGNNHG